MCPKSFSHVKPRVFRATHDSKIRRVVVGAIFVPVMNKLLGSQWTAQNFGHYLAMLIDRLMTTKDHIPFVQLNTRLHCRSILVGNGPLGLPVSPVSRTITMANGFMHLSILRFQV
jgi:hypothetical protein